MIMKTPINDCRIMVLFEMILIKQPMICAEVHYHRDNSHFLCTEDIITVTMSVRLS
jgi:hypothetical protein